MIKTTHVEGKDKGQVMLFALSTCVWCKKVKKLLKSLGVAYDYVDVDLLKDAESEAAEKEMEKWNSAGSFPTMVINEKKGIAGFKEDEILKELGG